MRGLFLFVETSMVFFILPAVWLVCGFLAYGIVLGDLQYGLFPDVARETATADRALAAFFASIGPFGLVAALIGSGFARHGLKFR